MSSQISDETSPLISYTNKEILPGLQGKILHANITLPTGVKEMAVKIWNESVFDSEKELERKILSDLQGVEGIARLVSFPTASNHSDRLFLEWANNGDLFTLIEKFQENMNPPLITHAHIHQLFDQLLTAVEAINKLGYVHRDVKPENILVYSLTEKKIDIGLSDFGLIVPLNVSTNVAGTLQYMTPTCRKAIWHRYDGSEDMYGVGITIGILLRFLDKNKFGREIKLASQIRKSKIQDIPQIMKLVKEMVAEQCPSL